MRDDGILTFYKLSNVASPGRMPVETLVSAGTAYYGRRNVGVTRMYAAAGANREFDLLVRCHNTPDVPDKAQYVILEDGKQYRIDFVQQNPELDAVDLTLVRLEANYDVAGQT
jgi:hypothetical protein